jgi:zona occludens toxin
MINLLLGAPGGGKSYEAVVYHVLPALQRGRKVVTNLPLHVEAFAAIDASFAPLIEVRTESLAGRDDEGVPVRVFAHVLDWSDPWRHAEGFGPLYVVDECHMCLPKGETDRAVEEWFSMHRHHNVDVLLITQSYGKISQAIRDLVQMVYRVRKNVALGSTSSYTRKVQDGLRGEVVNTSIRKYEAKHFPLYRSHTQGSSAQEFNASDVRPIWMHWSFLGAAACLLLFAVVFFAFDVRAPWSPKAAKKGPAGPDLLAVAHGQDKAASAPELPGAVRKVAGQVLGKLDPQAGDPFARMGVHLTGLIQAGQRKVWTFALSQNGQVQTTITDAEMVAAGYTWKGQSICSGVLEFAGASRNVTCDAPQVTLGGINVRGGGS